MDKQIHCELVSRNHEPFKDIVTEDRCVMNYSTQLSEYLNFDQLDEDMVHFVAVTPECRK